MGQVPIRRQSRMLRGSLKWIPVVVIPFSVLFAHAWLNVHILRADYVLRELDKEARHLQDELRHVGVVQAVQQAPETLAAYAAEMEFVLPSPGQQEIISYNPADIRPMPEDEAIKLARSTPASMTPNEPVRPATPVTPDTTLAAPGPQLSPDTPTRQDPAPDPAPQTSPQDEPVWQEAAGVTSETEWVTVDVVLPASVSERAAVVEPSASLAMDSVVEVPVEPAPEPVKPPVVLDLPEDAYVEDLLAFEPGMGTLESL